MCRPRRRLRVVRHHARGRGGPCIARGHRTARSSLMAWSDPHVVWRPLSLGRPHGVHRAHGKRRLDGFGGPHDMARSRTDWSVSVRRNARRMARRERRAVGPGYPPLGTRPPAAASRSRTQVGASAPARLYSPTRAAKSTCAGRFPAALQHSGSARVAPAVRAGGVAGAVRQQRIVLPPHPEPHPRAGAAHGRRPFGPPPASAQAAQRRLVGGLRRRNAWIGANPGLGAMLGRAATLERVAAPWRSATQCGVAAAWDGASPRHGAHAWCRGHPWLGPSHGIGRPRGSRWAAQPWHGTAP